MKLMLPSPCHSRIKMLQWSMISFRKQKATSNWWERLQCIMDIFCLMEKFFFSIIDKSARRLQYFGILGERSVKNLIGRAIHERLFARTISSPVVDMGSLSNPLRIRAFRTKRGAFTDAKRSCRAFEVQDNAPLAEMNRKYIPCLLPIQNYLDSYSKAGSHPNRYNKSIPSIIAWSVPHSACAWDGMENTFCKDLLYLNQIRRDFPSTARDQFTMMILFCQSLP